MTSNLSVYRFQSNNVRIVVINGEPWFVAKDVLVAIGSGSRTNDVKALVEQDLGKEYVSFVPLETPGGTQQVLALSEPALTLVIARSRTDLGKAMNRWIHSEVLPEIRRTGGYNKKSEYNLEWFDRLKIYRRNTKLPTGWFSIFEEMTIGLMADFEDAGYSLPMGSVPDISVGKCFCSKLRVDGIDTNNPVYVRSYKHHYPDGRIVEANIYSDELLSKYRAWFKETYRSHYLPRYLKTKDKKALPSLCQLLGLPEGSV